MIAKNWPKLHDFLYKIAYSNYRYIDRVVEGYCSLSVPNGSGLFGTAGKGLLSRRHPTCYIPTFIGHG